MASKPKAGKSPDASREIEDLDVREVSVVDKPAIRRKFLIVKSEGGLSVIRQEDQQMPEPAESQDDILDLLDVEIIKEDDNQEPCEATKAVDRLMVLASTLKAEETDTISEDSCDELCSIAEALVGQPVDKAEVAKLTPTDAETRVSKVIGQMMIIAKRLEDGADEDVEPEMAEIGSELAPLTKEEDEGSTNQVGTLKVFVGQGEDPEIIIHKAGAKMKRSRLSAFEKAVQTLVTLLSEIKGEQSNDKKDKTKKSNEEDQEMGNKDEKDTQDTKPEDTNVDDKEVTNKDDKPEAVTKEWVKEQISEAITKGLETVTTSIKELGDKFEKAGEVVTALTKRVDEMDAAPGGEGDDDPEHTEKKDKPFWGGRFLG